MSTERETRTNNDLSRSIYRKLCYEIFLVLWLKISTDLDYGKTSTQRIGYICATRRRSKSDSDRVKDKSLARLQSRTPRRFSRTLALSHSPLFLVHLSSPRLNRTINLASDTTILRSILSLSLSLSLSWSHFWKFVPALQQQQQEPWGCCSLSRVERLGNRFGTHTHTDTLPNQ